MYNNIACGQFESKRVVKIIKQLKWEIWKSLLTTTCGKKLECIGMTIDYKTKGKAKISIYEYIDEMLAELPSEMNGDSKTPATMHLFNVN